MEEITNRIEQEEILQEIDYRKPIMIGAGILIVYFMFFGYKALSLWFRSQLHIEIYGHGTSNFQSIEIILSTICIFLGGIGLYFFISGLRKMRRTKKKMESRNLHFLIIIYSTILIIANLFLFVELIFNIVGFYIALPEDIGWSLVAFSMVYSEIVFIFVIIMVLIQNYFLRENELINEAIVLRPIIHFFLLGSLIIWIFFGLNNYIVIISVGFFYLPFIICQFVTSFLAAGVYLELVIKIKKSKQEIKKKSIGVENG